MSFLESVDPGRFVEEITGLLEQVFKLRTLFDAVMDGFINMVPEDKLEDVAHAGKHAIDSLLYAIR